MQAQALQPEADAGHAVENGANSVIHQVVVQGKDGSPDVDADHVAPDPGSIQVDVAEAVTSARSQFAFPICHLKVLDDGLRKVSYGCECRRQMRGAVQRLERTVAAVGVA